MKNKIKVFLSIALLLFLVPPCINWIVSTPSPFGFITSEQKEAWIGFYGALIGGGLTLVGVWWTIKKQDEQRTEELRPIITIDAENRDIIELENQVKVKIHLKNVGTYEASNIQISYEVENLWALDHISISNESIPIIAKDTKIFESINFISHQTYPADGTRTHIYLTYYGLKGKKYTTSYEMILKKGTQIGYNDGWVFYLFNFSYKNIN